MMRAPRNRGRGKRFPERTGNRQDALGKGTGPQPFYWGPRGPLIPALCCLRGKTGAQTLRVTREDGSQ